VQAWALALPLLPTFLAGDQSGHPLSYPSFSWAGDKYGVSYLAAAWRVSLAKKRTGIGAWETRVARHRRLGARDECRLDLLSPLYLPAPDSAAVAFCLVAEE